MKIYKKKEFLKLPDGTIFCKGVEWCFDNMSIKGSSWENDFQYIDLCNIESNDTGDWIDKLEDSLVNGTSYPINKNTSRDGIFNGNEIFLVFEEKDLEFLIQVFKKSISIIRSENDI